MRISICTASTALLMAASLSVDASAQLVAGSPEDALYRQITAASAPAEKLALAAQFEEQFPNSPSGVIVPIFSILMDLHEKQQNHEQAVSYGEKIISKDPENLNAYIALCRIMSVNLQDNLPKAVEYGERAVALAEGLSGREAPANYTPEQWTAYVSQTETYARSLLSYARALQP